MGTLTQIKSFFFGTKPTEQDYFNKLKEQFFSASSNKEPYAGALLHRAFSLYPHNTALIDRERSISYQEFFFRTVILGNKLRALGVNPRDKVLLLCENSPEFFVAYYASWQLGAVVVPVNIFLHEKELAFILNESQPVAIFTTNAQHASLQKLVTLNLVAELPPVLTEADIALDTPLPENINELAHNFEITSLGTDELCVLLYTSGTTGTPKGVMLSSRNVLTNSMQAYARFSICNLTDQERIFCVLPLFHVFAQNTCLWLPVMTGASVIIVRKIDRKLILEGLKKEPTVFFGFPALYGLLCIMRNAPLHSIKMFISGADMLPDKIRSAFAMIYGRKICAGYGLSEASPVVGVNHENEHLPTAVIGRPLLDLECQIRDEAGNILPRGTIGTLWIKGDNIMMGYFKSPDATEKILQNGWLNTGDLATIDQKNNIAITGRIKDIIIHKGFNIYPAEVENILMLHPAVFKAAVVGREEAASGQIPVAYVAVKQLDQNLEQALRELCASNLAAYKIPRKFVCLDDLPMNSTGKIDKKQLTQ